MPNYLPLLSKNPPLIVEKSTTDCRKIHQSKSGLVVRIDQIRTFPLLTTRGRSYPLGLNERIVFSLLAYRARCGNGASLRAVSAATGLHVRTVRKCVVNLGGLVEFRHGQWWAVEPKGEPATWFATRRLEQAKHWSDRLARIRLFVPRKGAKVGRRRFSVKHAALFSELCSFARANDTVSTTVAGLGKLLNGTDRTTIQVGLAMLTEANLIQATPSGNRLSVRVLPVTEGHLNLFVEATPKKTLEKTGAATPAERPHFTYPLYNNIYAYCLAKGMPHALTIQIINLCGQLRNFLFEDFLEISNTAEGEHLRNLASGRFNSPGNGTTHHGRLLLYKLKTIVTDIENGRRSAPLVAPATIEDLDRQEADTTTPDARRLQEEMLADPLHEERYGGIRLLDIQNRVQGGMRAALEIESQISRHITRHVNSRTSNVHEAVRWSGNLYAEVVAHALHRLNGYYRKEIKATTDEFREAVNAELQERGIKPLPLCIKKTDQVTSPPCRTELIIAGHEQVGHS